MGLLVTVSHFTSAADQTAKDLGSSIALINGPLLAKLMIKYSIGCAKKDMLHIKQIGEEHFDEPADRILAVLAETLKRDASIVLAVNRSHTDQSLRLPFPETVATTENAPHKHFCSLS